MEWLRWIGTLIHRLIWREPSKDPVQQWNDFAKAAAEREKAVKKQLGSSK